MLQLIQLDSSPNQTFEAALTVDGNALSLRLFLNYNEMAKYWVMQIVDLQGNLLLDSVPLLTGSNALANLLAQFVHLGIGSSFIVNASNLAQDHPDGSNLGTDFQMVWGDTPLEIEVLA